MWHMGAFKCFAIGLLLVSFQGLAQTNSLQDKILPLQLNGAEISLMKTYIDSFSLEASKSELKQEVNSPQFLNEVKDLFSQFKSKLILKSATIEQESCANSLDTKIGINIQGSGSFKDFSQEIVNIENLRCLENKKNKSTQQIAEIILNDQFQLEAFENLKASKSNSDFSRTCQKTSVPWIGGSSYCFNTLFEIQNNTALILSIADTSENGSSAPIYLRWSGVLIHRLSDGKIKMYSVAYGRGPTIPFKSLAKKIMASQETKYSEVLESWINR